MSSFHSEVKRIQDRNDEDLMSEFTELGSIWDELMVDDSYYPFGSEEEWVRFYNALEEEIIKRGLL